MNIIIRNSDNVAVFSGLDISLDSFGCHGDGWSFAGLNNTTATLILNVTLPSPWVPSAYTYSNGSFAVFDQTAVNAANAAIAAAQAQKTIATAQSNFQSLIAAGIILTSTGTPALNATYSTTDTAQKNISGVVTGIATGLGLPGGGTTFQYLDASNVPHSFDASHFTAFAAALRNFVYNCEITLATIQNGGTATFPSNLVTIA